MPKNNWFIFIRVTKELHDKVVRAAADADLSISEFMRKKIARMKYNPKEARNGKSENAPL